MLDQLKKIPSFAHIEASNAAFTSSFLHRPLCSTQAVAQQLAHGVGKRLHASTKRSSHRLLNKGLIQSLLKRMGESSFLRYGPVGSWLNQGCQALPSRSHDAPRALCHSSLLLVLPAHVFLNAPMPNCHACCQSEAGGQQDVTGSSPSAADVPHTRRPAAVTRSGCPQSCNSSPAPAAYKRR